MERLGVRPCAFPSWDPFLDRSRRDRHRGAHARPPYFRALAEPALTNGGFRRRLSLSALGTTGIQIGALLLTLAWQNRDRETEPGAEARLRLSWICLSERSAHGPLLHSHGSDLPGAPGGGGVRFAPQFAPINHPIDHMGPPQFPMLLLSRPWPSIWCSSSRRPARRQAEPLVARAVLAAFLAVFFVTQWSFSIFQHSPAARNRLFGGDMQWSYSGSPSGCQPRSRAVFKNSSMALSRSAKVQLLSTTERNEGEHEAGGGGEGSHEMPRDPLPQAQAESQRQRTFGA